MIGPLLLKQRLEQAFLNMECLSHLSARRDGIARAHSFLTLRCWLFDYLIVWFFSPPWLLSFFWWWTSAWGDRLRKSRLWAGRNAGFFFLLSGRSTLAVFSFLFHFYWCVCVETFRSFFCSIIPARLHFVDINCSVGWQRMASVQSVCPSVSASFLLYFKKSRFLVKHFL